MKTLILLLVIAIPCFCQRPFYAGLRPIGYPEVDNRNAITHDHKVENLPSQLNGDKEYANKLDKLPIDNQPFWYINREKYEELINNPHTYNQRPSGFNENTRDRVTA